MAARPVLGAYSNPRSFWDQGHRFDACGINALFAGARLVEEVGERALLEGAALYAEFPTFRADHRLEAYPDLAPVGRDGLPIRPTERFLGACPTSPRYLFDLRQSLRRLVRTTPLAGVWLDYLHFHCDFELPEPPLDPSCFCDRCVRHFEEWSGLSPRGRTTAERAEWVLREAGDVWTEWKCEVVAGFAAQARRILDEERQGAMLGIFSAPWTDDEYGGAMRTILGEDIDRLHAYVDVFSPMVYHVKCGRPASWPGEYTRWLVGRVNALNEARGRSVEVWPIVEAHGAPAHELEKILNDVLASGATGVMFFALPHAASDPAKLAAVRRVYLAHGGG